MCIQKLDKIDAINDIIYMGLQSLFHQFSKYYMKLLLGDFIEK
jgi:hypothetical protein